MNWNEFEPYSTVEYYYNFIDTIKIVDYMVIMNIVDYLNMNVIMVYLELLLMAFKLIMVVKNPSLDYLVMV
jgi:hypothetical protein